MAHVLMFDSSCTACSRAAQEVARMGIVDLEVRGLSDPAMVAQLREAGLEQPDGPALLSGEGAQARLATGWAMRKELARLLGWRRATRIVRLVSIEGRARAARPGSVSRRRVLGTGLAAAAGALGSALLPDGALANTSQPASGLAAVRPAEASAALASSAVRTAVNTWGPAQAAGVATDPTDPVLIFTFANAPDVSLLVDNSAGATAGRMAVAVRQDTANGTLSFFGTDGAPFGTLTVKAGSVIVTEAPAIPTGIPTWRIRCFIACLGAHVSAQCALTCHTCVTTWNPWSRAISCAHCLICAGPEAVRCAKHCF
jgi:hypothetical protein